MADPFIEYQKELASRGLGGVFQEEGPGLGPSSSFLELQKAIESHPYSMGKDGNLAPFYAEKLQKLREQEEKGDLNSDFGTSTREGQKLLLEGGLGDAIKELKGLGLYSEAKVPFTLLERKNFEEAQSKEFNEAESRLNSLMEGGSESFAESPLDVIAAQIKKATASATPDSALTIANDALVNKKEIAVKADNSAKAEAGLAEEARLFDDIGVDKTDTAMEDALIGSMNPYLEAINKKIPTAENREDLLKKYKKEFSEATGIEIDGKVDKSQALMAMGLSLMQNRAGSGFNVGKILNAVGQAGDKAMPYLREATKEAKAAKVAAGKYALDKISSGESAAAAIVSAEKAFQKERYLKLLEIDADIAKEKIKAGGQVSEIKNVKVDKVINGLEVQRGRGGSGAVFVFPEDALRDSSGALKSVNGALTTVDTMLDLASQIANEESPTFSLISETVNTALVGAGLVDAEVVFGDSKVGKNQQIKILQDSIITQFKRMLTQETGNGISKSDVDNIKKMLGSIDLFGSPEESLLRLQEIKTLFTGKRTAIRGVLDELQSPDNYPSTIEYEKNMELYPTLISGSMQYSVNKNANSSVIDVKDD